MATDLVEVDEWTATVTVPEDGDDYDAASVEVPFQSLANRTVRLNNRIDQVPDEAHTWAEAQTFEGVLGMAGADNEISYQPYPRTRTIILPTTSAQPSGITGKLFIAEPGSPAPFAWACMEPPASLLYSFRLPHAAILQRVRVAIMAGAGNDVTVAAYQVEALVEALITGTVKHDLGAKTKTIVGDVGDVVTLDIPSAPATNGAWHTYCVKITLTALGSACAWVEVKFADPGPRNF